MKIHSQTDRVIGETGVGVGRVAALKSVLGGINSVRAIMNGSRDAFMATVSDVAMGGGESLGEGEGDEGEAQE